MTKVFNNIDEIASRASGMQKALQHSMDFYHLRADAQGVVAQPGDGNCWLHTSILGLRHINHPNLGGETHLTLRAKVVEWMQAHYDSDETLRHYIERAREAHKKVETDRLREQRDSLNLIMAENTIPSGELRQAHETLEGIGRSLEALEHFLSMTTLTT